MDRILNLIGRTRPLFEEDLRGHDAALGDHVRNASFLVIGGAGSIGQAVVTELFRRNPRVLHVVDLSENNLVELVRDLRSSLGYIEGDFRALPLDCASPEFDAFVEAMGGRYDYVLNLSALKHVRSEKDPFTLMRMVQVNVLNPERLLRGAARHSRKFFCVSTDKATNPVNMMGASKRIMELFLLRGSSEVPVSTARFANVAFSDGSLLHGFDQRIRKRQPISAPNDVRRYFITPRESGELCLMSCLLGNNREVFFPKLSADLHLVTFADIAVRYLENLGYTPRICASEEEARRTVESSAAERAWPCWFFKSDTTGEKDIEEFFTEDDDLDMERFHDLGVIRSLPERSGSGGASGGEVLKGFERRIEELRNSGRWTKADLVTLFREVLPEFEHEEKNRYLDNRM